MLVAVRELDRAEGRWPALVGRARERQTLRHQIAAAAAGDGRLVLVGGAAGIGKTALVAIAEQDAVAAGFVVLGGGRYDLSATPPFGPWRELVSDHRAAPGRLPVPAALVGIQAAGPPGKSSSSPRSATFSRPSPGPTPSSWSSKICTGPTRPVSTCCAGWPAEWSTCRSS